jgi:hypothetical protein
VTPVVISRMARPPRSKEEGPHLCGPSLVELPGIEPASLPGNLRSELHVRSVSVRFITGRYLRFGSRTLTASRAVTNRPGGTFACGAAEHGAL